jgi:mannose-6-phosphate isomerase-like protein (cupin superfamily)
MDLEIFDVDEALKEQANQAGSVGGRFDMATSTKCYIAVFRHSNKFVGERTVHSHPDSDQILFVLDGECAVTSLSGKYTLEPHQGVLVPGGVNYGFANETEEDLVFLSLRTESVGGRRVAYVPSVASDALVRIPESYFAGRPIGRYVYAYAIDRRTIGFSPLLLDDWNRGTMLRVNCDYERRGSDILVNLPERLARWYLVDDLLDGDYTITAGDDGTRILMDLSPLIDRKSAVQP